MTLEVQGVELERQRPRAQRSGVLGHAGFGISRGH